MQHAATPGNSMQVPCLTPDQVMHTLTDIVLRMRRPLTAAVAAAGRGAFVLDGTPRMRERPIQDLIDGLTQLGVEASCSPTGCPPVEINAQGLPTGTVRSRHADALQPTSIGMYRIGLIEVSQWAGLDYIRDAETVATVILLHSQALKQIQKTP